MATQVLNWCTKCKLECGSSLPTTAYVCVPAAIVSPAVTTDSGFVTATLTEVRASTCKDSCGACGWVYTISYDDTQLAEGYLLTQTVIKEVICSDCLTDFIENTGGSGTAFITSVEDTNCIDLDVTAGVLTASPIISVTAGNQLECTEDGLYVPESGGGFITAVDDTDSVNLTVTGTTLTADVEISATAGNQISIAADGLLVPAAAADFISSVTDTASVNLTVGAGALSADAVVSAVAGNSLSIVGDGLYAATGTGTVLDTTTITAPYNITVANDIILGDASGGSFNGVILPAANVNTKLYYVRKIDSTNNYVQVQPTGADTIEGGTFLNMFVPEQSVVFKSDGTSDWKVVASNQFPYNMMTEAPTTNLNLGTYSDVILADCTAGNIDLNLQFANLVKKAIYIKKTDTTTNYVRIIAAGADTIQGVNTYLINVPGSGVVLVSDGTSVWTILATIQVSYNLFRESTAVNLALGAYSDTVFVDCTAGNVFITLYPISAALYPIGGFRKAVYIKKMDASVNVVQLQPSGADTIEGAAFLNIGVQYQSRIIVPDSNTNWSIVGGYL